ncbi:hypothetical protein ADICYQ_3415 [Cyclobacterium qasimii M12-11B]|uniref:Uncharacterized protein n=1 Tax=Cyclobacterium qasimii M12-11B TaxID=641524 RepID=S7VDJ2_9BACT|nr:hypothetical protein ADICYQ_3415 [Cyclobacterium qasimii M12-11B]
MERSFRKRTNFGVGIVEKSENHLYSSAENYVRKEGLLEVDFW